MRRRQAPMANRQSQIVSVWRAGPAARRDCSPPSREQTHAKQSQFVRSPSRQTKPISWAPEKTCLRQRRHGTQAGGSNPVKQSQFVRTSSRQTKPIAAGQTGVTILPKSCYGQAPWTALAKTKPIRRTEPPTIPPFQYSIIPSLHHSTTSIAPAFRAPRRGRRAKQSQFPAAGSAAGRVLDGTGTWA